jgi:hypothetical protein
MTEVIGMKLNFGKLVLAPAVLALVAMASTTARADSTVKVPFGFEAGGKVFPAGDYTIQKSGLGKTVTIMNLQTAQGFTCLIGPGDPAPTSSQIVLRFDAAGDVHALRTIQYGSQISSQLDRKKMKGDELAVENR